MLHQEKNRKNARDEDERLVLNKKKQTKKKKNEALYEKGNREIIGVTIGISVLFLFMMIYFSVYALTHKEELTNNSFNTRQALLEEKNIRGNILDRKRNVLATTETDAKGKETRVYPYKELFAHAIGFSVNGKSGIEKQENYYLINSNISLQEKMSDEMRNVKDPGNICVTTLDAELQQVASDALGAYKGAVIAMDPNTGEILAMVSKPDFDPNTITQNWKEYVADNSSGVWLNRATQGLYPPGSTFKIITALEYIRENPDTWQNYSFQCKGSYTHGADVIQCYHGERHGKVDFTKSFAESCNSSFANIGLQLDRIKFESTLKDLLLNQKLPFEFLMKQSTVKIGESTTDSDMMQYAIGQGTTQMTPMQMALITSAVANQGVLMTPYIVDHIESADGDVIKQNHANEYRTLMTEKEAAVLTDFMEAVVQKGTATKLAGASYRAAGKTGSAEFNEEDKSESHAWFTGFAPVENPKLVVTVIIEGAGSGGDYAVPTAKKVFDAYLN